MIGQNVVYEYLQIFHHFHDLRNQRYYFHLSPGLPILLRLISIIKLENIDVELCELDTKLAFQGKTELCWILALFYSKKVSAQHRTLLQQQGPMLSRHLFTIEQTYPLNQCICNN